MHLLCSLKLHVTVGLTLTCWLLAMTCGLLTPCGLLLGDQSAGAASGATLAATPGATPAPPPGAAAGATPCGDVSDGWIELSRNLDAWEKPTGDWFLAAEVGVDPQNPRRLTARPGNEALVNGQRGETVELLTKRHWGDLEVQLEFMISQHSNSGVKLMGVYEIQILDTWKATKLTGNMCGGVYPRAELLPRYHQIDDGIPPRANAAKPPGQWQSLHIVFRAPRFDDAGRKVANARLERVLLNGVLIHENAELLHPTGNIWREKEKPTGPLFLQGSHGPVAFRNVRVRPLSAAMEKRE